MDAHLSFGETSRRSSELPNFQISPPDLTDRFRIQTFGLFLMPGLPSNHMDQRMQSHIG